MIKDKKKSDSGMSLVELMVAFGIFSILVTVTASLMNQHIEIERRTKITQMAQMIKQNAYDLIRNDLAWRNTIVSAENLDCICSRTCYKKTDPAKRGDLTRTFKLFDSGGGLYFDTTSPKMGYNFMNKTCLTYPSRECPFRLELGWRVMCNAKLPPSMCPLFPMLEVTGKVFFSEGESKEQASSASKVELNPENYAFTQVKTTDKTEGVPSYPLWDDLELISKRCGKDSEMMKLLAKPDLAQVAIPTGDGTERKPNGLNLDDVCKNLKKTFDSGATGAAVKEEIKKKGMGYILDQYQSLCVKRN